MNPQIPPLGAVQLEVLAAASLMKGLSLAMNYSLDVRIACSWLLGLKLRLARE